MVFNDLCEVCHLGKLTTVRETGLLLVRGVCTAQMGKPGILCIIRWAYT